MVHSFQRRTAGTIQALLRRRMRTPTPTRSQSRPSFVMSSERTSSLLTRRSLLKVWSGQDPRRWTRKRRSWGGKCWGYSRRSVGVPRTILSPGKSPSPCHREICQAKYAQAHGCYLGGRRVGHPRGPETAELVSIRSVAGFGSVYKQ